MAHPFDALSRIRDLDLWEADVYVEIFDSPGKLSVRSDPAPSQDQRQAFDAFVEVQQRLKPKVYQAILDYYLEILEECRERFSPDFLHLAPRIKKVGEVRRLLQPPYVVHL